MGCFTAWQQCRNCLPAKMPPRRRSPGDGDSERETSLFNTVMEKTGAACAKMVYLFRENSGTIEKAADKLSAAFRCSGLFGRLGIAASSAAATAQTAGKKQSDHPHIGHRAEGIGGDPAGSGGAARKSVGKKPDQSTTCCEENGAFPFFPEFFHCIRLLSVPVGRGCAVLPGAAPPWV